MVPDRSNTASTRTDYSSTDTASDVTIESTIVIFESRLTRPCLVSEKLWAEYQAMVAEIRRENRRAAQWILRIGMRLRFDPPDLMPVTKRAHYWKMLRCNRFGIGLRMGEAK